jgi:threonine synthase
MSIGAIIRPSPNSTNTQVTAGSEIYKAVAKRRGRPLMFANSMSIGAISDLSTTTWHSKESGIRLEIIGQHRRRPQMSKGQLNIGAIAEVRSEEAIVRRLTRVAVKTQMEVIAGESIRISTMRRR